jgi:hypothetical protein
MALRWLCEAVVVIALLATIGRVQAAEPKAMPSEFSKIEKAVRSYFKTLPDYQPGDIISRSQVEPLLKRADLFGWLGKQREAILDDLLEDNDFLVQQLRSDSGREFLKKTADYPGGLDRLDRWSRMNHGQKTVRSLIRLPVAENLIEYMVEEPGGKVLGRHESRAPGGTNLNESTGRIYTVPMLTARLKTAYHAESSKTAKAK